MTVAANWFGTARPGQISSPLRPAIVDRLHFLVIVVVRLFYLLALVVVDISFIASIAFLISRVCIFRLMQRYVAWVKGFALNIFTLERKKERKQGILVFQFLIGSLQFIES